MSDPFREAPLFMQSDFSEESFDTISTNATADDNVGPGRTLGLVYDFFGRKIENQLNRLAEKRGRRPSLALAVVSDTSSVSTNATADNLIGPGRTLGLLYSFLGRRLEARINQIAEHRGHGPRAAFDRLKLRIKAEEDCLLHATVSGAISHKECEKRTNNVVKALLEKLELVEDCKKLVKHTQ